MRFEKLMQVLDLAMDMQASYRGLSLQDIQDKLEVSKRTAQRMVRGLESVFPQLELLEGEDREHRWRLPAGTLNGLASFSADELAAVEAAANNRRADGRDAEADLLSGVELKIKGLLKAPQKRRIEPDLEALMQADGLVAVPGPKRKIPTEIVTPLRYAIKAGCMVQVRYCRRDGECDTYKLEPLGFLYGHRHYLVAMNPARDDGVVRKYRLGDIETVTVLTEGFERDEAFDLAKYAAESFGVFADGPRKVRWWFSKKAAKTAAEYIFHPSQKMTEESGGLMVEFKAGGLQEMAWHLMIWGQEVEVISPPELKEMVHKQQPVWDVLP